MGGELDRAVAFPLMGGELDRAVAFSLNGRGVLVPHLQGQVISCGLEDAIW